MLVKLLLGFRPVKNIFVDLLDLNFYYSSDGNLYSDALTLLKRLNIGKEVTLIKASSMSAASRCKEESM